MSGARNGSANLGGFCPSVETPNPVLLRSRIVVPICEPPIMNGAVLVSGERIAAVGKWDDLFRSARFAAAVDFGDAILMPGLINAHCHLDYTDMAGHFPPPKLFNDWLKTITETKAGWDFSDYARSWLNGAGMLLRTGTTTVADIEAVPELLPDVWNATPLRVISFLEMIGITQRRNPREILKESVDRLAMLGAAADRVGLSPHAPYSTLPELLRMTARVAREKRWRLMTHVSESATEYEMFTQGRGEMYEWLRKSSRDMSDCGARTPVEHLHQCGLLGPNLLVAHANYLGKRDAGLLSARKVSVVHCPRSHWYFRHDDFPLRRLVKAGVNVCLGTDSLASVCKRPKQELELDLFEEMRALSKAQPWLSPKSIVRMGTINGATGLGLKRAGVLRKGAAADLVAIPGKPKPGQVYESILCHTGTVSGSMIRGQWVYFPATN